MAFKLAAPLVQRFVLIPFRVVGDSDHKIEEEKERQIQQVLIPFRVVGDSD